MTEFSRPTCKVFKKGDYANKPNGLKPDYLIENCPNILKEIRENLCNDNSKFYDSHIPYPKSGFPQAKHRTYNPLCTTKNEIFKTGFTSKTGVPENKNLRPNSTTSIFNSKIPKEKVLNIHINDTNLKLKPVDVKKLEWTDPFIQEEAKESIYNLETLRFDFQGCPQKGVDYQDSILYHHGNNPDQPGYTLEEMSEHYLCSVYPAQIVMALQYIRGVLRTAHELTRTDSKDLKAAFGFGYDNWNYLIYDKFFLHYRVYKLLYSSNQNVQIESIFTLASLLDVFSDYEYASFNNHAYIYEFFFGNFQDKKKKKFLLNKWQSEYYSVPIEDNYLLHRKLVNLEKDQLFDIQEYIKKNLFLFNIFTHLLTDDKDQLATYFDISLNDPINQFLFKDNRNGSTNSVKKDEFKENSFTESIDFNKNKDFNKKKNNSEDSKKSSIFDEENIETKELNKSKKKGVKFVDFEERGHQTEDTDLINLLNVLFKKYHKIEYIELSLLKIVMCFVKQSKQLAAEVLLKNEDLLSNISKLINRDSENIDFLHTKLTFMYCLYTAEFKQETISRIGGSFLAEDFFICAVEKKAKRIILDYMLLMNSSEAAVHALDQTFFEIYVQWLRNYRECVIELIKSEQKNNEEMRRWTFIFIELLKNLLKCAKENEKVIIEVVSYLIDIIDIIYSSNLASNNVELKLCANLLWSFCVYIIVNITHNNNLKKKCQSKLERFVDSDTSNNIRRDLSECVEICLESGYYNPYKRSFYSSGSILLSFYNSLALLYVRVYMPAIRETCDLVQENSLFEVRSSVELIITDIIKTAQTKSLIEGNKSLLICNTFTRCIPWLKFLYDFNTDNQVLAISDNFQLSQWIDGKFSSSQHKILSTLSIDFFAAYYFLREAKFFNSAEISISNMIRSYANIIFIINLLFEFCLQYQNVNHNLLNNFFWSGASSELESKAEIIFKEGLNNVIILNKWMKLLPTILNIYRDIVNPPLWYSRFIWLFSAPFFQIECQNVRFIWSDIVILQLLSRRNEAFFPYMIRNYQAEFTEIMGFAQDILNVIPDSLCNSVVAKTAMGLIKK